ncbi:hypothetical protein EYR40_004852 [Pleurotus pulmonarius]|nr:hypothetical protein EYR36_006767 [Pleurotus pulmonarius]KAF4601463.1 hypothetical protein EYR38_006116 [Pleurotus pulmonarius]KAF4601653.1 hypothetical protein EYR40_004852 [Pleurotus pulmonarius]
MIQPNEALLICVFFLCFLQGIFTILLAIAIWLVFFRASPKGRRNWIGLSIVIFQYILSTAHFFMAFYQDIKLLGGGDPGPFADIQYHGKMAFTQVATEFFSSILADVLLTWRTYVIYGRNPRVLILPSLLIFATFIATYGYVGASIEGLGHLPTPDFQGIFDQSRMAPISTWNIVCMVLSVTTNVVLTVMTATKLLLHHRTMKNVHGFSSLLFESAVIIESGLLYTLAWIAYLVLFLLKSNADIVAMDIIAQLAGIVPTLIIVTISAGLSPVRTISYRRPPRVASTHPHASHLASHDIETEINFSNAQIRTSLSDMDFAANPHDHGRTEASPTSDAKPGIEVEVDVKRDVYAM